MSDNEFTGLVVIALIFSGVGGCVTQYTFGMGGLLAFFICIFCYFLTLVSRVEK